MLRRIAVVCVALVLLLAGAGALAYSRLQGNVERHDIARFLGGGRPAVGTAAPRGDVGAAGTPASGGEAGTAGVAAPADTEAGKALTILVLGSDSRAGANDDRSGIAGMRADTTILAHVAADRSRVDLVSIPRDTLVDIPPCTLPDGTQTAHRNDMINAAFAIGGQTGDVGAAAACSIRTVEKLTGVFVDDFVVVDFAGFKSVVDALGGVPMYVPEAIDDRRADVKLAPGCQVLNGHDALGFARVRKSVGDGSDISRIGRQQELVAAIAREALGEHLLTRPPALYRFLDATTRTLTTGEEIGRIPVLAGLAYSLRGIDPESIRFATMPFVWAGARVRPSADAEALWVALRDDRPVPAALTGTGAAPTPAPASESASPSAPGLGSPTAPAPSPSAPAAAPPSSTPPPASPSAAPTPVCTK